MLSELLHLKISSWQQVPSSAYFAHWLLLSLRHNLRSQRSHLFDFEPLVCCESGTAARLSVSSSSSVYLPPSSHTAALPSRQVGPPHSVCQHRTVPASLSQDKAHNSRISNPGILIWGRPVRLRGGVGWRQGQKEKEEGEALFGEAWAWWQEASPPPWPPSLRQSTHPPGQLSATLCIVINIKTKVVVTHVLLVTDQRDLSTAYLFQEFVLEEF